MPLAPSPPPPATAALPARLIHLRRGLLLGLLWFSHLMAAATANEFKATFSRHEDGSTWLSFPTYAGMYFVVEQSTDAHNFTPLQGGLSYGDGSAHEFYLLDPPVSAAPVVGSNSPPSKPTVHLNNLHFCYVDVEGDYRLILQFGNPQNVDSWALEASFTLPKRTATGMGSADLVCLDLEDATAHYSCLMTRVPYTAADFDLIRLSSAPTPAEWEHQGFLLAHSAEIIAAFTREATPVAEPTTPINPVANARAFYRVTCHQIDANGNGLYDWFELANGYNPFLDSNDPRAAKVDTPDPVTNVPLGDKQAMSAAPSTAGGGMGAAGSGLPAGEDLDKDGVADALEAIANDPHFTYPKSPESSYVVLWLDQLTGAQQMPRNYDDTLEHPSLPKLIGMNDLGQLFFEYQRSTAADPGQPEASYEPTFLVYDQGHYYTMPKVTSYPATDAGYSAAVCSSYDGGSLAFTVTGSNNYTTNVSYAAQSYVWSKKNAWGQAQPGAIMGRAGGTGASSTPIPPDNYDRQIIHWKPAESTISSYNNLGYLFIEASARTYPYNDGETEAAHGFAHAWYNPLGYLKGSNLALGGVFPASFSERVTRTNEQVNSYSSNGGADWTDLEHYHYPDINLDYVHPDGRIRVTAGIADSDGSLDSYHAHWYNGTDGEPFKTAIFPEAPEAALTVNSWSKEPKPTGSNVGQPYKQGPLFQTREGLATLGGPDGKEWHVFKGLDGQEAYVANRYFSTMNDRGEILSFWYLWRNNHRIDLSKLVDAKKPTGHPGVGLYIDTDKVCFNNKGQIAYTFKRFYGGKDHQHTVVLLPVELYSDLNNDGRLDGADSALASKPFVSGASEDEKDKGTEYMFANDELSNGAWDKEDTTTPGKPASATDDDDAEEIHISPGITAGEVWFDHPAISGMKFYRTKKCTEEINLSPSQHFTLSASNPLPSQIFIRAESVSPTVATNPQVEGELKLFINPTGGAAGIGIEASKMQLTIVKHLGANKHHRAAIDYILERNTLYYCGNISNTGNDARYIVMLPALTKLQAINARPGSFRSIHMLGAEPTFAQTTVLINSSFALDGEHDGVWYDKHAGKLIRRGGWDESASEPSTASWTPGHAGYIKFAAPSFWEMGIGDADYYMSQGYTDEGTGGLPLAAHVGPGARYNWNCISKLALGDLHRQQQILITAVYGSSGPGETRTDFVTKLEKGSFQSVILWGDGGGSNAQSLQTPAGTLVNLVAGLRHTLVGVLARECIKTYLGFTAQKPRP